MNGTLQHKDIELEHTGQYHLALKLDDNGFSFALYNPAVNGSYIYRKETFDLNLHNYLFALENAVYSYPFLLQNFRKTQILVQPEHFTFIPLPFASSRDNEIYFRFCFPESKDEILENNLSRCGSQLLFGIAPDVSDFLRRTFDRPQILHHLTPLCEYFYRKSRLGNNAKMYAHLQKGNLDLLCFNKEGLLLANTFRFRHINDAAYYILNAWQQLEYDQMNDELQLSGDKNLRNEITPLMREYITYVMPTIFPSHLFELGEETHEAPFDLVILPLCEL